MIHGRRRKCLNVPMEVLQHKVYEDIPRTWTVLCEPDCIHNILCTNYNSFNLTVVLCTMVVIPTVLFVTRRLAEASNIILNTAASAAGCAVL
jgi:hypothetical protein